VIFRKLFITQRFENENILTELQGYSLQSSHFLNMFAIPRLSMYSFPYVYKVEMLKTDTEAIGLVKTSADNRDYFTLSYTEGSQSPFILRKKNLLLLHVSIIGNKGFSANVDRANPFSAWL